MDHVCVLCREPINPTYFIVTGREEYEKACWNCRDQIFTLNSADTRERQLWNKIELESSVMVQVAIVRKSIKKIFAMETNGIEDELDVLSQLPCPPGTYIDDIRRHRAQIIANSDRPIRGGPM